MRDTSNRLIGLIAALCALVAPLVAQTPAEVRAFIAQDEGISPRPYVDSLGHLTIGIGHLVTPGDCVSPDTVWSAAQIERAYRTDLHVALSAAYRYVPSLTSQPPAARLVVIGLAFNLGPTGFYGFTRTRWAIDHRDYRHAASFLSRTLWASQVPRRAERYCLILNALP